MVLKKRNNRFLGKITAVVMVFITLLMVFDFYRFLPFEIVPNSLRFQIFAPVQQALKSAVEPLKISLETLKTDYSKETELLILHRDLKRMKIENQLLKQQQKILMQQTQLLSSEIYTDSAATPAVIVAHEPERHFMHLLINKGQADGLQEGMPVVAFEKEKMALVGFVVEVGKKSSMVQTLLDQRTRISVSLEELDSTGVVRGQSVASRFLQLEYINKEIENLNGLEVVTSGIGGKYPAGIPVGKVSYRIKKKYLIFQSAYISPHVNFFTLREVFVLPKYTPPQPEEFENAN